MPAADPQDPRELPATRQLDQLGVPYVIHRHPPLYTVAEAKELRGDIDAAHVKNLFLRDKKEQMWMVTVLEGRPVDTKELRALLGATGTVSFGSPDRLRRVLGIEPGSVSPLALVNDPEGVVRIVLDEGLHDYTHVGVHPLHNEATLRLAVLDLVRFLEASGRSPIWI